MRSVLMREFKGIRRTRVVGQDEKEAPLEFEKLNILIGPNNSGKSTVLEALALLPHPRAIPEPLMGMRRIDLISDFLHGDASGACLIYRYYGTARITYLRDHWKGKEIEIVLRKELGPLEVRTLIDGKNTEGLGPKGIAKVLGVDPGDQLHYSVMLILGEREYRGQLSGRRGYLSSLWAKMFDDRDLWRLIERRNAHISVAREVISPTINERLVELVPRKDGLSIRKEFPDGSSAYIRVSDLGSGVEKSLAAMALLEAVKPKLVLWDDFEASMHPALLKATLSWLARKEWQTVLATHSIDVLYSLLDLDREARERTRVMMLQRTPDDVLLCRPLTVDELEDLFLLKQDPRLVAGALGL